MKKLIALVAMLALSSAASAALKDGVYQGSGQGKEGPVQVEVSVKGGKIADVKVLKHTDTDMIFQAAQENVIPDVVKKGSTEGVEDVAGATLSSKGIKDAVNNALANAK